MRATQALAFIQARLLQLQMSDRAHHASSSHYGVRPYSTIEMAEAAIFNFSLAFS